MRRFVHLLIYPTLCPALLAAAPAATTTTPPREAGAAAAAADGVTARVGAEAADVLAAATRVETFRLKPERAQEGDRGLGGYVITKDGPAEGKERAAEVAGLLLDPRTCNFDRLKRCEFVPGVGYRLWKGERSVEVVLCFACEQVVIFAPPAANGSVRSAMADFAPARAQFLRLAREAFPDDEALKKLPDEPAK